VIANCDDATVIDSCADAVCAGDALSVTVTVKFDEPVPVGVQEMTPALDSDNPAGRLPALTAHVYPGVPPLAFNVVLYVLPVCAAPRLVDVIVNVLGAALTAIDSLAEAVCVGDALSVTVTVKFAVPFAVGVPEITPPLDSESPAGKLPDAIDHAYPGVPPLALSVALYELPFFPAARLVDVIVNVLVAALTVIDSLAEAVCAGDALSCTPTVNVNVPLAVGVPEIWPALERLNPAGRFPDLTDHVYPGVPPLALSDVL
jgi:hypothetical protein